MSTNIAIVGMACCYPEASDPKALWENVLAKRRAFRRFPAERLNGADYFSEDVTQPDKTYCDQAAFIEGYSFDREKYQVSGTTYRSTDLAHWLALDIAAQALADAGFPQGRALDKARTGVLVGNTLTGEFSRAAVMRLRWPYVRRVIAARLEQQAWPQAQQQALLKALEIDYKQAFEPVGEETLAGGLSNTIAGRICNYFDFGGGGYTVDGACSSSLLAVAQACEALVQGDLETMIVGGVDLSLDPFEMVGFAKTQALARTHMRVYDVAAEGFWPGEGCGFVVLMRYEDALAHGARCYGLIQGWGISSDGQGGITRPEVRGQQLALERAYTRAGYGIDTVALFEGHGTGTPVGDAVELTSLIQARHALNPQAPTAVLSAIKANIGHTKAAAGLAGLLKATLAVHTQILPPATACDQPHPLLTAENASLQVLNQGKRWSTDRPLRAGVSSFGFGGINVHITLEGVAHTRRQQLTPFETQLLHSHQDSELYLFSAADLSTFVNKLQRLQAIASQSAFSELTDLAAHLAQAVDSQHPIRAAIIATTPSQLVERLAYLLTQITTHPHALYQPQKGLFFTPQIDTPPRITYLLPGQASPVHITGGLWAQRFHTVQALYERASLVTASETSNTQVMQPAIVTASLAGLQVLEKFGITAQQALGHSLGEWVALYWAGAIAEAALFKTITARAQAMAEVPQKGAMVSLEAAGASVEALCTSITDATIACFNGPRQTVVSGDWTAIEYVMRQAQQQSLKATRLPVSQGFHSPLMTPAAQTLAPLLAVQNWRPLQHAVFSTITGRRLDRQQDLSALLLTQMTSPVRFTEAVQAVLPETDLFIEVGPGQVLTDLIPTLTTVPVMSVDAASPSLHALLTTLGTAYVMGAPLRVSALFADRFSRPFSPDKPLHFFSNPCESAPSIATDLTTSTLSATPAAAPTLPTEETPTNITVLERLRQSIASHAELPLNAVRDDSRLLADLHLNSITVSQVVGAVRRQMGLAAVTDPTAYATATLAEVAQALEQHSTVTPVRPETKEVTDLPVGIDPWVRAFVVALKAKPLPASRKTLVGQGGWQIFASPDHPLRAGLAAQLTQGSGVILCLPVTVDETHIALILQAAQQAIKEPQTYKYFVLVQAGLGASALARTFFQEMPTITTCVVTLPFDAQAVDRILDEIGTAHHYQEAYYDAQGERYTRVLRPLPLTDKKAPLPLTPTDVLLVSGGGKGITAECAVMLACERGVQLALLGRADPEQDAELAHTLQRLQALDLTFDYWAVDITQAEAVKVAIADITQRLGPITAILHGAGSNRPTLLRDLDAAACRATLAPKVGGLKNLLAAIDPQNLRLLVSFGSFIAPAGMPGEADYALANEWLAAYTADFQNRYPQVRCLTLEWSVWSEVGMGERLGRVEFLAQQGITPISPQVGLGWLRRALITEDWPNTTGISGRMPPTPTLQLDSDVLPFLRFLERPRVHYPDIELIVEAELSPTSDPYLADHVFAGQPLLPAVIGLEAMAQVAMALKGTEVLPHFTDVAFNHPIVVENAETLQIAALVRDRQRVDVVLRCAQTQFKVNHFQACCDFGPPTAQIPVWPASTMRPVEISPEETLYSTFLFQRGRFQRLQQYRHLEATQCTCEIIADDTAWFGRYLPAALLLGDAGVRDAAIHAIQACIPQAQLLPVRLERLTFYATQTTGNKLMSAKERWRRDGLFCYDLLIYDQAGEVCEQWEGLYLQQVSPRQWAAEWPEALLAPYLERQMQAFFPTQTIQVEVCRHSPTDSPRSTVAFQRLLGSEITVIRDANGKPAALESDLSLSAAHAETLILAVASSQVEVACDIELVIKRTTETWHDLLGEHISDLIATLRQQVTQETQATAATRLWTVRECLKKAGVPFDIPVTLKLIAMPSWMLFEAGEAITIATGIIPLKDQLLAVAILVKVSHASL